MFSNDDIRELERIFQKGIANATSSGVSALNTGKRILSSHVFEITENRQKGIDANKRPKEINEAIFNALDTLKRELERKPKAIEVVNFLEKKYKDIGAKVYVHGSKLRTKEGYSIDLGKTFPSTLSKLNKSE